MGRLCCDSLFLPSFLPSSLSLSLFAGEVVRFDGARLISKVCCSSGTLGNTAVLLRLCCGPGCASLDFTVVSIDLLGGTPCFHVVFSYNASNDLHMQLEERVYS